MLRSLPPDTFDRRPASGDGSIRGAAAPAAAGGAALSPLVRRLVEACTPGNLIDRIETAFLGTSASERRSVAMGFPRAAVYWQCLEGFLAASGRAHLGRLSFARSEIVPLQLAGRNLGDGEWLEFPANTQVFADGPQGREIFICRVERGERPVVGIAAARGSTTTLDEWEAYVRRHHPFRGRVIDPTGKRIGLDRAYTWDDLFLAERVKEEIRRQVVGPLAHGADALAALGIRRRRGVILAGPPGTGKTLIGRILASVLGTSFLWVTPGQLADRDAVGEVMALARLLAPTVLFLEDIDILAEDRATNSRGETLGELMNQLDGCAGDHAIVTIATTNRLEVLESAVRNRPGRFDRVIEVPAPDRTSCVQYLKHRLGAHGIGEKDLAWLAQAALGRTGAELEELANTVLLLALNAGGGAAAGAEAAEARLDRALLAQALESTGGRAPGRAPKGFLA